MTEHTWCNDRINTFVFRIPLAYLWLYTYRYVFKRKVLNILPAFTYYTCKRTRMPAHFLNSYMDISIPCVK